MKKIALWMLMLTVSGVCAVMANDRLTSAVRRLIEEYPAASHRMEYRYSPGTGTGAFRELRFDFCISRDSLRPAHLKELQSLCDKAWNEADPATDRMLKYEYGDSVCSTIVYGIEPDKSTDIQGRGSVNQFWGNRGFLIFDTGKEIKVVVDRMEHGLNAPQTPVLDDLTATFDSICMNRDITETRVRYTGSKGSFVFQRENGRGWTKGLRKTVRNCRAADFYRLRKAFRRFMDSNEAVNVIIENNSVKLKNEKGPEVLIASIGHDGTLSFLDATVEKEICVPMGWETIDCYNNGNTSAHYVDVSRLDCLFDSLMAASASAPVEVSYTGSWSPEITGFEWQRGNGRGWTRGQRFMLDSLTSGDVKHILDTYMSYGSSLGFINSGKDYATTFEEGTRTFYGFRMLDDGKAYFLKATTEDEICVPMEWPRMDHYKGPAAKTAHGNAVGAADKTVQRLYGLSSLWSAARQSFVFMDSVAVDWDSLYVAMIPRMAKAAEDFETVSLLQEMAARLRDGHTSVYDLTGSRCSAPLTARRIGGRVYVDRVLGSDLARCGVRRGQEITAVNSMTVDDYVRKHIEPYASSSTPQWLEHICYEEVNAWSGKRGEPMVLTLRDGDRVFDVTVLLGAGMTDLWMPEPPLSYTVMDDSIGYLRIPSFQNADVTEAFDSIFPEIMKSRSLIIDIRGNGGGNSLYAEHIMRRLATDTVRTSSWRSPVYIPAYASWGLKRDWYNGQPKLILPEREKAVYDRPAVMLVDNRTFSAAEDFVGMFRSIRRGLLVGRPTGGSTGNGVRVELIPGVAIANICSKHDTAADGTEFVGHGFIPDITVEETYNTIFADERDAAITAALRILGGASLRQ